MRVKLFTLRYSATLGGFDEGVLQAFLADKEILAFREHFFHANETPHLACIVLWQEANGLEPNCNSAATTTEPKRRRGKSDPTAGLDERGRILFQTLRTWRARTAREEGVPPYIVFTNRELVEIVQRAPRTPNALSQIPGIGPAKVRRYGASLLEQLGSDVASDQSTTTPPSSQPAPEP